jgi:RNA polymerase sigma-70 factor (TIGR02960 family)
VTEPVWIEPLPDTLVDDDDTDSDPAARYDRRESVELAFVAALQALPGTQRAVLILRDVLALPAAEVATFLDTSVASVNSALQRARQTLDGGLAAPSQQAALRALGDDRRRSLVDAFVSAWESRDVDGVVRLLADDARFAMPPLPAWFQGPESIATFLRERAFATPWRAVPTAANGQLAFALYQGDPEGTEFPLGVVAVVTLRDGRIADMNSFLDPAMYAAFGLPAEHPAPG